MTALDRCKVCHRETEHTLAVTPYGDPNGWRCVDCGARRLLLTARAVLTPPQAVPR